MFSKIHQIITDHRAMNLMRERFGDMQLVAFYSTDGSHGFDCYPFQRNEYASANDPAQAIIDAVEMSDQIEQWELEQPDEAANA